MTIQEFVFSVGGMILFFGIAFLLGYLIGGDVAIQRLAKDDEIDSHEKQGL